MAGDEGGRGGGREPPPHRLADSAARASRGERAGGWRASFAADGVTLSQPDCLIAAAAVGVGARLATGNPRDFPMEDLEVEDWPVG